MGFRFAAVLGGLQVVHLVLHTRVLRSVLLRGVAFGAEQRGYFVIYGGCVYHTYVTGVYNAATRCLREHCDKTVPALSEHTCYTVCIARYLTLLRRTTTFFPSPTA